MTLTKREVAEARCSRSRTGRIGVASSASRPTARYVEEPLPAVRAPHEGASCLRRLAAIAATL